MNFGKTEASGGGFELALDSLMDGNSEKGCAIYNEAVQAIARFEAHELIIDYINDVRKLSLVMCWNAIEVLANDLVILAINEVPQLLSKFSLRLT